MNQILFLMVTGTVAFAIQSSVIFQLVPPELRPDLTLIVLAWASSHSTFLVGVSFSFVLGLCLDIMTGSPLGLSGLLYLITYIIFGYLDSYFEVTGVARNYISIFLASCIIFTAMLAFRALTTDIDFTLYNVYWIIAKSLSTATFSWVTLKAVNIMWKEYSKVAGAM